MYQLFAWSQYTPQGGDDDFAGVFATTDAAIAEFNTHEAAWEGEAWIGHITTFDGTRFARVAWLCREQGATAIEWE